MAVSTDVDQVLKGAVDAGDVAGGGSGHRSKSPGKATRRSGWVGEAAAVSERVPKGGGGAVGGGGGAGCAPPALPGVARVPLGMRSIASPPAMTEDSVFWIASM